MASVGSSVDVVVTTVDDPAGFVVVETVGLVIGSYGHPLNRYLDQVKALIPGERHNGTQALVQARMRAVEALREQAALAGCNAVIGVQFTSRPIGETWVELCAYGTGVLLERIDIGLRHG